MNTACGQRRTQVFPGAGARTNRGLHLYGASAFRGPKSYLSHSPACLIVQGRTHDFETIPLFVVSKRHPNPPMVYVVRAWWTSSTGQRWTASSLPEVGDRRWLAGCVPDAFRTGDLLPGWDSLAQATSIFPRTTVPPPLSYVP